MLAAHLHDDHVVEDVSAGRRSAPGMHADASRRCCRGLRTKRRLSWGASFSRRAAVRGAVSTSTRPWCRELGGRDGRPGAQRCSTTQRTLWRRRKAPARAVRVPRVCSRRCRCECLGNGRGHCVSKRAGSPESRARRRTGLTGKWLDGVDIEPRACRGRCGAAVISPICAQCRCGFAALGGCGSS